MVKRFLLFVKKIFWDQVGGVYSRQHAVGRTRLHNIGTDENPGTWKDIEK